MALEHISSVAPLIISKHFFSSSIQLLLSPSSFIVHFNLISSEVGNEEQSFSSFIFKADRHLGLSMHCFKSSSYKHKFSVEADAHIHY